MSEMPSSYPATLSIDYPDRKLNRLTTFFRIFTVIPIAIILGLIIGGSTGWQGDPGNKLPDGSGRRNPCSAVDTHDPFPQEISSLVVRLECQSL